MVRRCAAFAIGSTLAAAALALPSPTRAQGLLANPSFEVPGFGGWNHFGSVAASAEAVHGLEAVRVFGPDDGGWDLSALWQNLDSEPGDQWAAAVHVRPTSSAPLTGQSRAILNVEWRDAGGALLSYESHTLADASTPADTYRRVAITSQPAPSGTVSTHFLFGVLQAPGDAPPAVDFDQATFDELGPPSLDDVQWNDFPGGRTIAFGGRTWRVKGPGFYGPGPNLFRDAADAVWVDASGRLHLTIRQIGEQWYSTEVVLEEALGYGDYRITTEGRLDQLDLHAVLGLFLWQYPACWDPATLWWNPANEIDVEFGRWGDPGRNIGQFVAQPYDHAGNLSPFDVTYAEGELATHAFRWLPDRVEFRSWRGGPDDETPENLVHSWTYAGWHLPRPEQPRVHLNLWKFDGTPAADQEVIIDGFRFVPADDPSVAAPEAAPPATSPTAISTVHPNPFRGGTTLRFSLERGGTAEVTVYDVGGRRVRDLGAGPAPRAAGDHAVVWDGRNDAGRTMPAGVYFLRLRTADAVESHRLVRVR